MKIHYEDWSASFGVLCEDGGATWSSLVPREVTCPECQYLMDEETDDA